MELTNKKIILLVIAIVVILAVFTGIVINKYSMPNRDSGTGIGTNSYNVSNIPDTVNPTVSISPTSYPVITPTVTGTTIQPIINNSTNSSELNNSSNITVSPTATVTDVPESGVPTGNPSLANHYGPIPGFNDNSIPLFENGRITVQLFLWDGLNDTNSILPGYILAENLSGVSDAKATLIKRTYNPATNNLTYEVVNISNNPLMASNCVVHGKAAYTFTNVPAIYSETELYLVWIEKDGRRWTMNCNYGAISAAIARNDSAEIISP